ncbi:SMP-30/gluconolactonase/LRE family protein [Catalinimonas sp. 4WD22]|uniref:SMP-30/gluconolactonase/LRE family protein n=1 Tax=Catalinimonas locisalis TaxID=3133978 RepID=UPI0031018908
MRKNIIWKLCLLIGLMSACSSNNETTTTMEATLLFENTALLGEGPIWNHETQQLYWIDIEKRQLHLYTPETNEDNFFSTGERVGTVVPIESGGALVALENGIHSMDLQDGELTFIANPLEDSIRFNDGKCDPLGRLWVGSMHLQGKKGAASLYMMDQNQEITQKLDSVTISNGIIWSLDNSTMYYIDTPTRQVKAFDYDIESGEISSPRVVINVPQENGAPDGMTIDEEGMLWIGHWGGGMVGRYNPETGKMVQKIEVPALNVTACAFGGENLDKLYITTATIGMSEEQMEEYPQAGGLFVAEPGVKGVPADFYRGL